MDAATTISTFNPDPDPPVGDKLEYVPAVLLALAAPTVSIATTFVNAEDYIAYDDALAANTAERITGLVVGPGQNIIVYSSAADISYNVTGFESASEDYVQVLNTKSTT